MAELSDLEVMVEPDGTVRVSADVVAACGLRPGDQLRLVRTARRRRRSMLGVAASASDFTTEHQSELRHEMGEGLGEDLSR